MKASHLLSAVATREGQEWEWMWVGEKEQGKKATRTVPPQQKGALGAFPPALTWLAAVSCCPCQPAARLQQHQQTFTVSGTVTFVPSAGVQRWVNLQFITVLLHPWQTVLSNLVLVPEWRAQSSGTFTLQPSPPCQRIIQFKWHAWIFQYFISFWSFNTLLYSRYCHYFFSCAYSRDLSHHVTPSCASVLMGLTNKEPWTLKKKKTRVKTSVIPSPSCYF